MALIDNKSSVFRQQFEIIEQHTPFNEGWNNGTGYLDHAVKGEHAPKLKPGEMIKSVTVKGRQIIIVGTRFGNVVVFERYLPDDRGVPTNVWVSNHPYILERAGIISSNVWREDDLLRYLTPDTMFNIGHRVEDFCKAVTNPHPDDTSTH